MRRIAQKRPDPLDGDCFLAALASLLEIDPNDIPRPRPHQKSSDQAWDQYMMDIEELLLRPRGLYFLIYGSNFYKNGEPWWPKGYALATVSSRRGAERGIWHSVIVYNGRVVWDPNLQYDPGVYGPYECCLNYTILVPYGV